MDNPEDKPKKKRNGWRLDRDKPEKVVERLVLEDMRPRINSAIREDRVQKPRQSMSRVYQETRRIARLAGPAMMERLVYLAENSPDDRVSMMSSIAVLDRAGVTPLPYNPDEETRELLMLPLEERKEKLRLLMIRANELMREVPPVIDGD